jgi:GNAT superfamily N-acetyltransferase
MAEITPVRSSRERRAFIELPFRLYRDDPLWVPPLRSDMREMLDPQRHPFHWHSAVALFLARDARGRVTGRIAAIHNTRHLEQHEDGVGFFGFFESERDAGTATALIDAAAAWLKERGLRTMRGPANFSSNEDWGLLVEGFDRPPMVMMPYNPPWYAELLEGAGCRQEKDLVAYWLERSDIPDRLVRGVELMAKRNQVELRELDMRRFDRDVELLRDLYNRAWERNWGAVQFTPDEFTYIAKKLRPVVDPSLVAFVTVRGELAGFCLALPDLNVALARMNGRLFPLGWAKGLWYGRKIDALRVLALGVLEPYRRTGAAEVLYMHLFSAGFRRGITKGEFSWILADNMVIRRALEKLGSQVYKRYRLFDRGLM